MSEDEEISFHKLYPKADNAMRAFTMTRAKMDSRIPLSGEISSERYQAC